MVEPPRCQGRKRINFTIWETWRPGGLYFLGEGFYVGVIEDDIVELSIFEAAINMRRVSS
jgi:hypothetical protein